MPSHRDTQTFTYTPNQLFDLVADVASYPQFLPWCRAARILAQTDNGLDAELLISFHHITERYSSRITLTPHTRIEVAMLSGPFEHLTNDWRFEALPDGGTRIDFFVDFKFKSRWMEALIGRYFQKACEKMMAAFTARAHALYASGASGSMPSSVR